jgi:pSer/pThr/pTyr-binding forkhead associated (FHA) protein
VSELTLTLIKLGYLALLWLFVFSVVSALRADIFGVRVARPPAERAPKAAKPSKPAKPPKGAPARALVVEGPDRDRWVALADAPVVLGRGADCTFPLTDEYTSQRHARLVPYDGQWYVEDLGSTNGTYVSGTRITRAMTVGLKTPIKLGRTVLELRK